MHEDCQRIFLVDQSIETFKAAYNTSTIKPMYKDQDVSKSLKLMKSETEAHAIVKVMLENNTSKEYKTSISKGIVIGDRFLKKPIFIEKDEEEVPQLDKNEKPK